MARIWLAVLLLLATFSSHPVGSVEQRAPDSATHRAPPAAIATTRPSGEAAVAALLAHAGSPGSIPITDPPAWPAPSAIRVSSSVRWDAADRPMPVTVELPSYLERLPYDATAPPARK
jgi:hypothetical protein